MKILVFDDNKTNREAAKAQLKGHDLTVVGTYDEARKMLGPRIDHSKVDANLKSQFGYSKQRYGDKDEWKYCKARVLAEIAETKDPDFDIILADLLVPGSSHMMSSVVEDEFIEEEMPVGIFIGLLAAVKTCVKIVAVFTDSDHHSHPASACFDSFNESESSPTPFVVNGSKVFLVNNRQWIGHFDPKDLSNELEYEEYDKRSDTVRAKKWDALLKYLLS
ncbi:MAG: hypothetical protein WCK16_03645 [Candidatus Moraniibacteriota bacterium]|jgi:CheY-like chemotaxis protein